MKILVIGGGGREHALIWKLARDPARHRLFCAPGNAGTARLAVNLPIAATDLEALREWAAAEGPDLVVVGPEAPLCDGLTDLLEAEGIRVFGPSRAAARLEGSKIFAKEVMLAAGVPTAGASFFTDADAALRHVEAFGAPLVVKADGLAAGKGVAVCRTTDEARGAVQSMLRDHAFGEAGKCILIEECLEGEEASVMALVDGHSLVMLAPSQDHKRVLDGDQGPNTGGMGAYSPTLAIPEACWPLIQSRIFEPTLQELARRGIHYKGVLYAGIMMTSEGPKVLEYNCRFGDPETQVVLPRLASELLPALEACVDGTLDRADIRWLPDHAVCVVCSAGGYPGPYEKGIPIQGLDEVRAVGRAVVFHAGTALRDDGQVVTDGGRVLGVTALGATLQEAVSEAYRAVSGITFQGAHHREDIAWRELQRQSAR